MRGLTASLLMFLGCLARADILFLDLNNAQEEISAASRAAEQRGERLIVIPNLGREVRQEQERLSLRLESVAKEIQASCQNSQPNCEAARTSYQETQRKLNLVSSGFRLSGADVAEALKKLQAQGVALSSVVISGHDGNGKFVGVQGSLDADDLEAAFSAAPQLTRSVRSVLLWGCYTTTLGSLDGHWKRAFPNVSVFAGFDGRGPNKYRPANHQYLEDFLRVDQNLIRARDSREIQKIGNQIRGFQQTNSAVCVNDWILTSKSIRKISELRSECQFDPKVKDLLATYQCLREAATDPCANPPTRFDSSPLRDLYNYLESKTHCRSYWSEQRLEFDIPEPQNVMALMFFDNIKMNLGSLHAQDLAKVDALLKEVGAPQDLKVSELDRLSRRQIKKRLADIENFLASRELQLLRHPKAVELDVLRGATRSLNDILSTLVSVPPGWHERADAEPSGLLSNSLSRERWRDIQVEHAVLAIDKKYEATKQQLMVSHPSYGLLISAREKYHQDLQSAASASEPDRPKRMSQMRASLELLEQRQKAIEAEIVTPLKVVIQTQEIGSQSQAGGVSREIQGLAIQQYFKKIQN